MAISSRKAGTIVDCPTCGEKTLVPADDVFLMEGASPVAAGPLPPAAPSPPIPAAPVMPAPQVAKVGALVVNERIQEIDPAVDEREPSNRSPEPVENENEAAHFVPSEVGDDEETAWTIRRRRNPDDEMDLTPMVDVTFQLLIFFMVSASFSLQKTIEVPTPDPNQQGATQQMQTLEDLQGTSIVVRIDAGNNISIDDEPLSDVTRLTDTMRDKMRREQKTELLVTAHSQSLHRTIIAVIDAANDIGMQKIRMASQKKTD
jgi:biopolymer transport protein ExbD